MAKEVGVAERFRYIEAERRLWPRPPHVFMLQSSIGDIMNINMFVSQVLHYLRPTYILYIFK